MPLHPQVQAMRDRIAAAATPKLYTLPIEAARKQDLRGSVASAGQVEPVAQGRDFVFPRDGGDLAAPIYRPAADCRVPAIVDFFRRAWSPGALVTSCAVCRVVAHT